MSWSTGLLAIWDDFETSEMFQFSSFFRDMETDSLILVHPTDSVEWHSFVRLDDSLHSCKKYYGSE